MNTHISRQVLNRYNQANSTFQQGGLVTRQVKGSTACCLSRKPFGLARSTGLCIKLPRERIGTDSKVLMG